jgi:hypothetical protein
VECELGSRENAIFLTVRTKSCKGTGTSRLSIELLQVRSPKEGRMEDVLCVAEGDVGGHLR